MTAAEFGRVAVPVFDFPWPAACHPEVDDIERVMLGWGTRQGLIPDGAYRARVVRTRYGHLTARCYPHANRPLVQTIADYFLWFFLADDLFVDRVDTVTPRTIHNLTAMIDVLDLGEQGQSPVYGEPAWQDVCTRLRDQLSPEHFQRFADGMRLWAATAGLQILNHLQPQPIEIRHYETIRRHTSGMNPCLALSDAASTGAITPEEYHHPTVAELRRRTNNVVCWSNDIQSLVVEAHQPGQFRNMVTLYAAQGRTPQEAVDHVAGRIRTEIAAFVRLADTVRADAGPRLQGYITGLQFWMRGYQDWVSHDTHRYDSSHAEQDADDRNIPT